MNRFPRLLSLVLLLLWCSSVVAAPRNVVLMVADDLGLQVGFYGDSQAKTPNMDRLAAEGTRFMRAYCTTSSCSASRSVILSGQYNHATAHYGHEHGTGHFRTYDDVQTLPVLLQKAGYRTASIGKYHVAPEPVYHFENYLKMEIEGGAHNPVGMAVSAKKWIEADDGRPFFLYFCGADPHRVSSGFGNDKDYPGVKPVTFDPATTRVPEWLPDLPETRREWAEFLQATNRWDQGVGAVMNVLEETGHLDDTLVLMISDNGPPFPGAKTTTYEPGIRLPLIVRHPQADRRGVSSQAGVTWADLAPTILDYAGVPVPPGRPKKNGPADPSAMHGRSFLGVLDQETPSGWEDAYFSHTFHEVQMYYPMRGVVHGRYKYIFNIAHGLPYPFASDLYASKTWQAVMNAELKQYGQRSLQAYLHRSRHELYDLETDPHESRNLADDPRHAETLAEVQKLVRTFQQRTNDPWHTKWTYE